MKIFLEHLTDLHIRSYSESYRYVTQPRHGPWWGRLFMGTYFAMAWIPLAAFCWIIVVMFEQNTGFYKPVITTPRASVIVLWLMAPMSKEVLIILSQAIEHLRDNNKPAPFSEWF